MQNAVDRKFEAVILVDRPYDLGFARQHRVDGDILAQHGADLVERDDVVGVGHRQHQGALLLVEFEREDAVTLGDVLGDQLERGGVHHHAGKVRALLLEVLAQRLAHRRLGDEAEGDEQLAQLIAGALLLEQGDAKLVFADHALLDQQFA